MCVDFTDVIALLTIAVTASIFWWHRRVTRRKLIDAVYHHVVMTEESLNKSGKEIEDLPGKIQGDPLYTPYYIVAGDDNLTYDQIIGLMWWLSEEEEEAILRYFHAQAALHAVAISFGEEVVRKFPKKRKLLVAAALAECCRETREHARTARRFLEKKKERRLDRLLW